MPGLMPNVLQAPNPKLLPTPTLPTEGPGSSPGGGVVFYVAVQAEVSPSGCSPLASPGLFSHQYHLLLLTLSRVAMRIMNERQPHRASGARLSVRGGERVCPPGNPPNHKQEGKAEELSPRRDPQPRVLLNHVCDMQVNSSHSRPPIQAARFPLKPKERWLQKQTELSLGGSSSGKTHGVKGRGRACLPRPASWRIRHNAPDQHFLNLVIPIHQVFTANNRNTTKE